VVAAGAASVVVDDDGEPLVRGRAALGEAVVVGDESFGEEGLVVVVRGLVDDLREGSVVDVRGLVADVTGAATLEALVDVDRRTTLHTLVTRRMAATTAHSRHFL
jgi:hypothetical protein